MVVLVAALVLGPALVLGLGPAPPPTAAVAAAAAAAASGAAAVVGAGTGANILHFTFLSSLIDLVLSSIDLSISAIDSSNNLLLLISRRSFKSYGMLCKKILKEEVVWLRYS